MQGEFYPKGKTLAPGLQALDPAKLTAERPEYVLFDGKMGARCWATRRGDPT